MSLTALEIYKKLPQTNCAKCLLPSCMAFAAALTAGRKKVRECPDISPERAAELSASLFSQDSIEIEQAEFVDKLQKKMFTRIAEQHR